MDQTQAEHGLELDPVPIQHLNMTGNSVLVVVLNNRHVQHQHIVQVRLPYTGILYRLDSLLIVQAIIRQPIFTLYLFHKQDNLFFHTPINYGTCKTV